MYEPVVDFFPSVNIRSVYSDEISIFRAGSRTIVSLVMPAFSCSNYAARYCELLQRFYGEKLPLRRFSVYCIDNVTSQVPDVLIAVSFLKD